MLRELLCDGEILVRNWRSQTENVDAITHRTHEKSAKEGKDTSNEHQQTLTEMQSVENEMNAVKDTWTYVQKTMAAMENKIAGFEKTNKKINKNVTHANVTKKNQVVIEQQNRKIQQAKPHRITRQIVIITNADTTTVTNILEIRTKLFDVFLSKRLTYAFWNSQKNLHLELDN